MNELLIKLLKEATLNWDEQVEIMRVLFDKVENKEGMIYMIMHLMQLDISERRKELTKYVCAVESGHPLQDKDTSCYNFIQYIKQHTKNGTTVESCESFNKYFNDVWLPFAKEKMFDSIGWQEEQEHKVFFDNLKELLKEE